VDIQLPATEIRPTAGRRVRQRDIAEIAGVTRSTVSVILSGKSEQGHIAPATRDRVLEVARRLGYQSNPLAQRLNGIKSRIIGVHTYGHDMSYREMNYNAEYLFGVQQRVTELGYDLLLFTSSTQQETPPSAFPSGANRLSVADGSVIIGYRADHAELARLWSEGYKFVRIDRRDVPGTEVQWVDSDHVKGAVAMVEGLLDAGYERLIYLGMPDPIEPFLDRQRGFQTAMTKFDLPKQSFVIIDPRHVTPEWLRSVSRHGVPTLVAERWGHAENAAISAESLGLDVPIAVLQSPHAPNQDHRYCAYLLEPKLEIGRRAVDLLVAQIEGKPLPTDRLVTATVSITPPDSLTASLDAATRTMDDPDDSRASR
jgi:DNA-binding LacI/PurR family transcriptional regulator